MSLLSRNRAEEFTIRISPGLPGFTAFLIFLLIIFLLLPPLSLENTPENWIFTVGFIALWRYSWAIFNFVRSAIYRDMVFPRWRALAEQRGDVLMPSKIYIVLTAYRIDPSIMIRVFKSVMEEAARCRLPVTLIASIVELQDEFALQEIYRSYPASENIELKIIRIPGTGKRDGVAHGFRAISRDMPPADALVVVMDGDTVLCPGVLGKSVPFFKMSSELGALTTDEYCEVRGAGSWMREWFEMRLAQRHILMSSQALSRRVMTLTGRMSIFRANIVVDPDFITHMSEDYLDHWRLGRFKFLTGDDKSSLYWVLSRGYKQIYVPDAAVLTLETPPAENFVKASTLLMFRWFGNMLRTNSRILNLSPERMPFFTWWSFLDQRISMWTSLSGPVFAILLSIKLGWTFMLYYLVWVFFIRAVMSLVIFSVRGSINWRYPFLLYYNHIYGSLVKVWMLFHLDQQSWTRQKTRLQRGLSRSQARWNAWGSHGMSAATLVLFVCVLGIFSRVLTFPHATVRMALGPDLYPFMH